MVKVSESRAKSRAVSDCVQVGDKVLYAEGYKHKTNSKKSKKR